jgi:hypothetical protein
MVDRPREFCERLVSTDRYTEGTVVLEQTPRNGEHLQLLRYLFPDALILFVARNPVDTMRSMQSTPWASKHPLAQLAIWARPYVEAMRMRRAYGCGKLRFLCYSKINSECYRADVFAWLDRHGVPRRPELIEVVPRNFADTDWATDHLHKSASAIRIETPHASRGGDRLRRFGDRLLLAGMRLVSGPQSRPGWPERAVQCLAWVSKRVLGR